MVKATKFSEKIEAFPVGTKFKLSDETSVWVRTEDGYAIDLGSLPEEIQTDVAAFGLLTGNPGVQFDLSYAYIFDAAQKDDDLLTLDTVES